MMHKIERTLRSYVTPLNTLSYANNSFCLSPRWSVLLMTRLAWTLRTLTIAGRYRIKTGELTKRVLQKNYHIITIHTDSCKTYVVYFVMRIKTHLPLPNNNIPGSTTYGQPSLGAALPTDKVIKAGKRLVNGGYTLVPLAFCLTL